AFALIAVPLPPTSSRRVDLAHDVEHARAGHVARRVAPPRPDDDARARPPRAGRVREGLGRLGGGRAAAEGTRPAQGEDRRVVHGSASREDFQRPPPARRRRTRDRLPASVSRGAQDRAQVLHGPRARAVPGHGGVPGPVSHHVLGNPGAQGRQARLAPHAPRARPPAVARARPSAASL
ncbi:uncharacterized protein RHOBADRAFT_55810, partial [Rhodotorula graminis WP1]